ALSATASKTGWTLLGELLMTLRISEVAVCCSSASARRFCASASSRVSALTCSCRSAWAEPAGRAAIAALFRSGFVVLACCVFVGSRLIVRRRLTEPFPWADGPTLPHQGGRCAPQQNSLSDGRDGSPPEVAV